MARRMFKCPKCDRRFAMAMHLARHTSTIHASKSKKGRPAKRNPAKRKKKRRVRAKISRSLTGPARALRELRTYLRELSAKRNALDVEIRTIQNAINTMGRATKRRR